VRPNFDVSGDPRPRNGEGSRSEISAPSITPVLVAELLAEGERMPVYVHVIDHPDARVLVDTGLTELHPAVADMDPRLVPLSTQAGFDVGGIDVVINTHLHFDHCGGNHLFAGRPTYVQRRELDDARSLNDYTIRDWVDAPGVQYVPVDGELEVLPGVRLVPTPATLQVHRWSSSRQAAARSSSLATRPSSSASSTSRAPKASGWSARSTQSSSGSPTSTSRGGRRLTSTSDPKEPDRPKTEMAVVTRPDACIEADRPVSVSREGRLVRRVLMGAV